MSQGCGLDLKDVVCHVPGRDTSLRRMYASHGVPTESSTDGRSEKFAITNAERQWTKRVWRSNDSPIVIDVRSLRGKDGPTFSKTIRDSVPFQEIFISVEKEL